MWKHFAIIMQDEIFVVKTKMFMNNTVEVEA